MHLGYTLHVLVKLSNKAGTQNMRRRESVAFDGATVHQPLEDECFILI